MDVNGMVVLVALVACAALALATWAYQQEKKKVAAMAATASANGWRYLGDDDRWVDAWDCEPFHTGKGRRIHHLVEGSYHGVPFLAFEYTYYTESTTTDASGHRRTSRTNHTFDVGVLRLGANVPDLRLRPEGALARLVDAVTGWDIDLESDAFNRAYRLHCGDRKFAFDTFHARTMEHLVARPGTAFELVGGDALMARRSQGFDPTIWGPGEPFDAVLTVLHGIPDFVWQDRGGRPAVLSGHVP
jgi:hypothetical protein